MENAIWVRRRGRAVDRIAARPMRNEGQLMINHAIQRVGRGCNECHSPEGILDFASLGYAPEEVTALQEAR